MGFDIGYSGRCATLRDVIAATTGGRDARVDLDRLRDALIDTQGIVALDRLSMHREPRPARFQP
jgi:hypothetical protein